MSGNRLNPILGSEKGFIRIIELKNNFKISDKDKTSLTTYTGINSLSLGNNNKLIAQIPKLPDDSYNSQSSKFTQQNENQTSSGIPIIPGDSSKKQNNPSGGIPIIPGDPSKKQKANIFKISEQSSKDNESEFIKALTEGITKTEYEEEIRKCTKKYSLGSTPASGPGSDNTPLNIKKSDKGFSFVVKNDGSAGSATSGLQLLKNNYSKSGEESLIVVSIDPGIVIVTIKKVAYRDPSNSELKAGIYVDLTEPLGEKGLGGNNRFIVAENHKLLLKIGKKERNYESMLIDTKGSYPSYEY